MNAIVATFSRASIFLIASWLSVPLALVSDVAAESAPACAVNADGACKTRHLTPDDDNPLWVAVANYPGALPEKHTCNDVCHAADLEPVVLGTYKHLGSRGASPIAVCNVLAKTGYSSLQPIVGWNLGGHSVLAYRDDCVIVDRAGKRYPRINECLCATKAFPATTTSLTECNPDDKAPTEICEPPAP